MSSTIGLSLTQVIAATGVPAFRPGTLGRLETEADGTKEYVYVQTTEILAFGSAVIIFDEENRVANADLALGAVTHGARVGVCVVVMQVSEYGWVQVYGRSGVTTLANAASGAQLNLTATSGALDDDATAGAEVIDGILLANASGGGVTVNLDAVLNYPTVGRTL